MKDKDEQRRVAAKLLKSKDHVKRYKGVREGQPIVDTGKYDKDEAARRRNRGRS